LPFTRALAKEIGNRGIRGITVNNITPWPLTTSFFYKGQLGEITDIVPLVKFLVSPEAGWVTAQTIFINGGFLTR
jgi:NAD(P)-dependent dehydrogenase (short-subunit alcohol dehydrogenase family)